MNLEERELVRTILNRVDSAELRAAARIRKVRKVINQPLPDIKCADALLQESLTILGTIPKSKEPLLELICPSK